MSKKIYIGKVITNSMDKTVKVLVESEKSHRLYGKKIKSQRYILAHVDDKIPMPSLGSYVEFIESRPYSKMVKFLVLNVLEGK
jgi:small subunit ribosomal protein S17